MREDIKEKLEQDFMNEFNELLIKYRDQKKYETIEMENEEDDT